MCRAIILFFLLLPALITGCATPKYACGVPEGIGCKPLSEVHRMVQEGTLKAKAAPDNRDTPRDHDEQPYADLQKLAQDKPRAETKHDTASPSPSPPLVPDVVTATPGAPLFTPPRTLRVWVARWLDEGGTLYDETYLYLKLDNGHWVMEP